MKKAILYCFLAFIAWKGVPWGKVYDFVSHDITRPQAWVIWEINARGRDVQNEFAKNIDQRRKTKTAAEIANSEDPGEALYDELSPVARKSRMADLAIRKANADVNGTRVPMQTSAAARGNNSEWQLVRNEDGSPVELFEGDIICASGIVTNRDLTDGGQLVEVNPNGIHLRQAELPDGFSQRYEEFPMMAFLGRVNHNNNSIFHIKNGCHPTQVSGQNLEIVVNVAYRQQMGWEAPSIATNKGNGNFVVERIEHRKQVQSSTPAPNPSTDETTPRPQRPGKIYITGIRP